MKTNIANDNAAAEDTAVFDAKTLRKGKVIKTLTLPYKVANDLERFAKETKAKQADIVKVAFYELKKQNNDKLNRLFIDYEIY